MYVSTGKPKQSTYFSDLSAISFSTFLYLCLPDPLTKSVVRQLKIIVFREA